MDVSREVPEVMCRVDARVARAVSRVMFAQNGKPPKFVTLSCPCKRDRGVRRIDLLDRRVSTEPARSVYPTFLPDSLAARQRMPQSRTPSHVAPRSHLPDPCS